MEPGVTVRHVTAGPFQGLSKEDLPGQLCAVTSGVLRAEAARPEGWYDLVHSHYWLSGQVGWLAAERWNVPLVHAMHTMAKVKNLTLAEGDLPEPEGRVIGEQQVVDAADRIVANTDDEADQLVDLYGADPGHVAVVHPGVDLDVFSPGDKALSRARLGVDADRTVLLFVGRIQPLKAPDVLVRALAAMVARTPSLRETLQVVICGGPSGSGLAHPHALEDLAVELGVRDLVRFVPPVGQVHARRLVPRRRRLRGAVVLRVVRARRGRGAGLRHPGRRGPRRRSADRGGRRRQRPARRRPRPVRVGRGAVRRRRATASGSTAGRAPPSSTRRASAGTRPPPRPSRSTATRSPTASPPAPAPPRVPDPGVASSP